MITTLFLLGFTGDLARRFLLPGLGALHDMGRLPDGFGVLAGARKDLDDESIRHIIDGALPREMVTYRAVDLADPATLRDALRDVEGPVAVYLALPPAVFETTVESLGAVELADGSRIVVEKPFGDDEPSARALNEGLAQTGVDAYRVDHVLGLETTRNLVAMRSNNPALDAIWNGEMIERIEILWEETLALEGRAGYYDDAGALKDVLQNHMLQLLALIAMDSPSDIRSLHEEKEAVLKSVRVGSHHRRARYRAGTLADGRSVPSYVEEEGVDPARATETFAEMTVSLDTPRWQGTEVCLRAGKALSAQCKLARFHFRGGGTLEFGIEGPTDIVWCLHGDNDELQGKTAPVVLRGAAPGLGLPPYAHVLWDVLNGTDVLSVGAAEAETAWRVVAPIVEQWRRDEVPMQEYPAGSEGPQ